MSSAAGIVSARANESKKYTGSTIRAARPKGVRQLADFFNRLEEDAAFFERELETKCRLDAPCSRRDSCSSRMSSIGVPEGEPLPDEEEQQNDQELCRQSVDSHVIRRQIDEMFDFGKEDASFFERELETNCRLDIPCSRRDSCSSRMSTIGVPEGEPLPDEEEQQNDQELCRQSVDSHVIRRQIEMFDFGKEDASFFERELETNCRLDIPCSRRDSCSSRMSSIGVPEGESLIDEEEQQNDQELCRQSVDSHVIRRQIEMFDFGKEDASFFERELETNCRLDIPCSRRDSCSSRMSSIGVPEGEPLIDEEEQQNDQELCRQSVDSHVIRRQIEMFDFGKEDAAFFERERELPVNEPPRGFARRDSNSTCTGRYAAYSERGWPSHGSNRVGLISQFRNRSNVTSSSVCIRAESPQPQFSPAAVHAITESAGQRVAAYEAKEGQRPVRVHSGRCVPPSARATSTPLQSTHSSVADRGSILIHGGQAVRRSHVPLDVVQNLSFISSISTGSAEGEATVIRRGGLTPGKNDVPPFARDFPRPSALDYKVQIARMKDMQGKEEEKIKITTKALTFARKKQKRMNEMSAQRSLLLARLRVSSLKKEQQRLSALSIVRHPPPPISRDVLGAMDVSDITIHLNRGLTALVNESDVSYSFVVVLKCGVEVDGTAPVTILVGPRPSVRLVHFPEHLRFSNLPVDFMIGLEVYVMKQRELKDENCAAALASKARSFLLPAGGIRNNAVTSGDLPISEFVRCGLTALNRDTTGVMRFYLDGAEYPLEGTIELAASCTRLPSAVEIDFRGFLTMYKVVGGLGSWVRFWAVLRRAVIYFWKYPDDEMIDRAAVASAYLSKCMNSAISPCSRDVCSRPHTFSLDMLVSAAPSIIERKRVLLAADSKDQLNAWVAALNETLAALRG